MTSALSHLLFCPDMAQNAVLGHRHGVITGEERVHTAAGCHLGSEGGTGSMGRCDDGSERVGQKLHPTPGVEELGGWESELGGMGVLVVVGYGGVVVDAAADRGAADGAAEERREERGGRAVFARAEEVVRDVEEELGRDVIEEGGAPADEDNHDKLLSSPSSTGSLS